MTETQYPGARVITLPTIPNTMGTELRSLSRFGFSINQLTLWPTIKGKVSADHFHYGKDPAKNPEYTAFCQGYVGDLYLEHGDEHRIVRIDARVHVVLTVIEPLTWHRLECLQTGLIIEARSTEFDENEPDTCRDHTVFQALSHPVQERARLAA